MQGEPTGRRGKQERYKTKLPVGLRHLALGKTAVMLASLVLSEAFIYIGILYMVKNPRGFLTLAWSLLSIREIEREKKFRSPIY
jgi:hypothetical protein